MPIYEYRCASCDAHIELRRPAAESNEGARCSCGAEARRVLSVFATVTGGAPSSAGAPSPMGCGADCACAANL